MPERRQHDRPGASDRRTFPRPPLWLNLLLILLGAGGLLFAHFHRERVSTEFADVITEQARTPTDVKQMKDQLAEMDLTRDALQREVQGRSKFIASLKSENFYLSIDTRARKLRFNYGDKMLRETDVTLGDTKTVAAGNKVWTFVPLKGAFPVEAKLVDYAWHIPEWVYAMNQQPVPPERPTVAGGLGRYVIFLGNGYAIHTQPSEASPLKGAKPGSYMIDEETMRAIWPRITAGKTQVYIF